MSWRKVWPLVVLFLLAARGRSSGATSSAPVQGKRGETDMRIASWTPEELSAFVAAVKEAGVDPAVALEVYNFESSLQPHAVNKSSGAQGLAQIMPAILKGLDYTGDGSRFHELTLTEQLPYVTRLLKQQVSLNGGKAPATSAKLFHLQLWPATASGDVVFSRAKEPKAYAANAGLDVDKKGFVDESDLARAVERVKTPAVLAMLGQIKGGEAVV